MREDRARLWVTRCFGKEAMSPHERACRLLEEAIELAQAEGVDRQLIELSVAYIYERPPGDLIREGGGVALGLYGWAASRAVTVTTLFNREIRRIEAKSVDHFRARQKVKADAGMSMKLGEGR